jgi:hypothetical protein
MEAVSATYNISIPSKCKYAEVVSDNPIVRRIAVTEEVSAPDRVAEVVLNPIAPLTDSELSEHQKAVPVTSVVAERTSAASLDSTISFIPKVDNAFVPWGNISDIKER